MLIPGGRRFKSCWCRSHPIQKLIYKNIDIEPYTCSIFSYLHDLSDWKQQSALELAELL